MIIAEAILLLTEQTKALEKVVSERNESLKEAEAIFLRIKHSSSLEDCGHIGISEGDEWLAKYSFSGEKEQDKK